MQKAVMVRNGIIVVALLVTVGAVTGAATLGTSGAFPWSLLLVGLLAAAVTGGFVLWYLQKQLIQPIREVTQFARRVATGDLSAGLQTRCNGEMRQLQEAQQEMLASLRGEIGFCKGVMDCISHSFPYLTVDRDGKITDMGEELIKLLDLDGKSVDYLGVTPGKAFFGDANRSTISTEALERAQKVDREADITTGKGNRRVFRAVASPIYDFDGQLVGSFTLYVDLTKIRMQDEELRCKNESIVRLGEESRSVAEEVTSASQALTGLIDDAHEDAKGQKIRAAEVATAMEEMNATVLEVARNSQEAAKLAQDTSEQAEEGGKSVKNLVDNISGVDAVIKELSKRMVGLGSKAENIDQVVSVISDIADQTNLLALNAAIEAARAGDAGKGFAVVADEVRKLAEKTMAATREVGDVITGIQQDMKQANQEMGGVTQAVDGVSEMAQLSGAALHEILELVKETTDQVRAIATAVEQQSAASEQINRSIGEMDSSASHTDAIMEEAAMRIAGLSGRAKDLASLIDRLMNEDRSCTS